MDSRDNGSWPMDLGILVDFLGKYFWLGCYFGPPEFVFLVLLVQQHGRALRWPPNLRILNLTLLNP